MLELRPVCENCNKLLPPGSVEAMICSFECTFCEECVGTILKNVCPNCGGGFVSRPIRPKEKLDKYPPTDKLIHKPVDLEKLSELQEKYKDIEPEDR